MTQSKKHYEINSFNLFWKFLKQPIDTTLKDVLKNIHLFKRVTIPHDWLIYNVSHLYETSSGWYYKEIDIEKEEDYQYTLRFEGVYMDSTLYINDIEVGSWKNGYTSFEFDITQQLKSGNNTIIMQVRYLHPNSRWYSGAGIYRNVDFVKKHKNHLLSNGIYTHTIKNGHDWRLDVETEYIVNEYSQIRQRLYDRNYLVKELINDIHEESNKLNQIIHFEDPNLWSPDEPHLYTLETSLMINDEVYDQITQNIGFKDIIFDANKGLFINGKHLKLHGVCEHHDLGLMGGAFNRQLKHKRLEMLKNMGVNAIRAAHSVPSKAFMEMADEMGFLVISEAFDMWERPKTTYDYSRFFKTWVDVDVKSWIERDRNHVSLLMWSIGNEIYDTHVDEHGLEITHRLVDLVKKYDPKGNGEITIGSNFMMGEHTRKCTEVFKFAGYNYGEVYYKEHHRSYPDWYIYGSETSSMLQSRGVYHFPLKLPILVDDDQQCSCLGNSVPSWGAKSIESVITYDRDLEFSLGQFIWTGYDYLGEPTPYETVNSYFGQIDTAGFPKDTYYVYQAAWTDGLTKPMIHVFPYWNFNDKEIIDVRICSNQSLIKLFFNDELIGERVINMTKDLDILPTWKLPYKDGVIKAIAYDRKGRETARCERHTFGEPDQMKVTIDKQVLNADGEDVVEITVEIIDKNKHIVENSNLAVKIEVEGPAKILGMDNGDSTDHYAYKTYVKPLFSGKLKIVVGSTYQSGDIKIKLTSKDLMSKHFHLTSQEIHKDDEEFNLAKEMQYDVRSGEIGDIHEDQLFEFIPINQIKLSTVQERVFTPDQKEMTIHVEKHPANASKQDLVWKVVSPKGIPLHLASLEETDEGMHIKAIGDGDFIVRCMAKNTKDHPDIISSLVFKAEGIGQAYKNPYEMIIAGLYDRQIGEIKAGQQQGAAMNEPGSTVIFDHVDFGDEGSSRVKLSIFSFESKVVEIKVYDGHPKDPNTILIDTLKYFKETIWNVYQDEVYTLSRRFQGYKSIAFEFSRGVHFLGFEFEHQDKTYEQISILDNNENYGDQYEETEWGYQNIGNNVSFKFQNMKFSEGVSQVEICGRSKIDKNSMRLQYRSADNKKYIELIEFEKTDDFETKIFNLHHIEGLFDVEFIFLPGSQFDFKWFRFIK